VALFAGPAEAALTAGQVAFLFPGQGAQAPDLCRDLWERLPTYRERLTELARSAEPVLGRSFLDALYPEPHARDAAAAELTRTEVCQPALAALELALVDVLAGLGVEAGVMVGHSLGELVAVAAGGALDAGEAVRLVAERGRLMAELDGDHGAMAALATDRDSAARLVDGQPGAVLANFNHPRQVVVSGESAAVDKVVARAGAAGVRATRLPVSHGFHSPIVAPMAGRFRELLAGADVRQPDRVVVSCAAEADGEGLRPGPFEPDAEAIRARMARHALAAIDFESGVRAAWSAGARVFLQVGAGSTLLSMARATLAQDGNAARLAAPLAPAETRDGEGLLLALARLVGLGLPLATAGLYRGRDVHLAALPPSLLETRPFWVLKPLADPPALPDLGARDAGDRDGVHIRAMADGAGPAQEVPRMSERSPAPRELVDLFQRQLDVIQGQIDVLRSHGVEAPAATSAASAPAERAEVVVAASTRANGHATRPAATAPALEDPGAPRGRVEIEKQVLEIVSRVSALPVRGLSLSARLSEDLGIDSLMMVELGGGLQEAFGLREVPDGIIGRDATLADIVDRLAAHMTVQSGASSAVAAPVEAAATAGPVIERHVAEWTAQPLARDQAGQLAAPGGAVIAADAGAAAIAEALAVRLRAAGRDVHIIDDGAELAWPAEAGLFIDISDVRGAGSNGARDPRAESPAAATRRLRAPLERGCAAMAAAARSGVRPAYVAATSGPGFATAAGFARALAAERPDRLARAIELPAGAQPEVAAERIEAEIATSDRTAEVSWATGERRAVTTRRSPLASASGIAARTALITGGGRGLGGRLALGLARAGVANLALVGRRQADADVERLLADLAAAGAAARYFACDVRDAEALAATVAEARAALGPIELVAHAAGVNVDGPVDRTRAEDLELVFDTKVGGALNLWAACAGDPLAAFLLYGSWAGRFGNRHQSTYAAANRALAALAGPLAAGRADVRVAAVDLPPWEGGGMVERLPEPIRRAMRARGVPFLTDETGLAHLMAELSGGPGPAEVVLGAGPSGSARRDRARLLLDPAAPWLADHAPGGEVRLPLAAALERAVAAADRVGVSAPLSILDFQVLQAISVPPGGRAIEVEARRSPDGSVEVELWLEADDALRGEPRLAASGRIARAGAALPALSPGAGELPRLDLDRFYAEHTFHGPRMRGIARVDEVGESHARGVVTTAEAGWPRALDILGLDGALQLAGFFARERLGRSALPIGAGECRVLAPLPAASELLCVVELERADGEDLLGHIDLCDAGGRPLVQLRRVRARVVDDAAVERAGKSGAHRDGNGQSGASGGTGGERSNGHAPATSSGNGHSIDPATYRVEQFPELLELQQRMKMVEAFGLRIPYFHEHEGLTNQRSVIAGVEHVNYSSYNYVGLSGHPEVNRAVEVAIARYGTSVSASRLASGEKPLHRELEGAIAGFLGCEDAVVMVGGHATNVSVIGHMLDSRDLVLHDSLAHDSILGGARLAGARRRPFPHNDVDALARLLEQVRPHVRRVLIAVEGVYSMDGDLAPLDRIIELKKRFGALLLVDEAHSLGVVGATGRGIGERFGVRREDVDLWMGTLSKSLASCGGYIAGSAALVQFLKYTNPGFVYSVGISPANAAAALAALRLLEREPERVATLQARSRYFIERLRERGIDTGLSRGSAVVPCIVPSSVDCLRLAQALSARRINVQPILYPAVEENLARLRFFVTSGHSDADLLATAEAVREELAAIDPRHLSPRAPAAARAGSWEASP
jgi:8-amino-7-oxononanoate synthase